MKTVIIEDKQRIESIILHCDACFVGITDLEGNPYVVPMNFGYENGIIYLHSPYRWTDTDQPLALWQAVEQISTPQPLTTSTPQHL